MMELSRVLLVVCVCVVVNVSLVQSGRQRYIPRYCRQFIDPGRQLANTQSSNDTVTESSEDEHERDADDDLDALRVADEEIDMFKLMIDFMT